MGVGNGLDVRGEGKGCITLLTLLTLRKDLQLVYN